MRFSPWLVSISLVLASLSCSSCSREAPDTPAPAPAVRPTPPRAAVRLETLLRALPPEDAAPGLTLPGEAGPLEQSLRAAYQARRFRPLWFRGGRPTGRSVELVRLLERAHRDGLDPRAYHPALLASALRRAESEADPRSLASADSLLSWTFLLFARNLSTGRVDPSDLAPDWHLQRRRPSWPGLATALEEATGPASIQGVVDRLRPPHPGYRRLRKALERYRRIARDGGWATVPAGPVLEPGDPATRERLTRLAARLAAEGDLPSALAAPPAGSTGSAGGEPVYDETLARAVRSFQARLGLTVDGKVGPETVDALNVPARERVRQIELNMERWRWLPAHLGTRRVEVNIPAFSLRLVDGGRTVATMKVVVGKQGAETPAFRKSMTYVVVNPYWNVPESIARREIAPEAARDPSYLAARRYQVVSGWGDGDVRPVEARSVDWASVADGGSFPFRLRQLPGPGNALGRIKFMLPNPYDVYLHDTPATHLFTRARRTFSHGCVRVAHPLELAQWAFRGDPRWNRARLASAVASGRRESIALPRPIPVYLLYWTAWADSDGSVHFRDDVYGRDRALSEALGFGEDAEESAPPSGPVRSARLDASRVGAEPAW